LLSKRALWASARFAGSLESVADLGEHIADFRADKLEGDNDENRNQAGDERVLDRRYARFVT
jgi:hypothetical protein